MKVLMNVLKRKVLLSVVFAALLVASYINIGQLANAAEDVVSSGNSNLSSPIDASNLANGNYYIDYTILYANEDKTSMSSQYLVSPALLKVDGDKQTVSFTVLQSKEIVGLKLNGQDSIVTGNDIDNNKRIVSFEIDDLTGIHPGWISINWVIEAIKFKYINEYDIRFKFLPETIVAVEQNAPVPTKDGNVGFPKGMDESSEANQEEIDNDATVPETVQEEQKEQEQQSTIKGFKDIDGHWAKAVIERAVQLEIADGYSDGTFKPNDVINRSQFAVMLSRALKLSADHVTSSFADQAAIPSWATEHINRVVAAGLFGGYSDQTFRGNNNISRTEMAVIIARAAQLDAANNVTLNFADAANIPAWAQKEVAAAVHAGLISGKENNRFEPAIFATRAEALTIIMRLLDAKNL